MKNYISLSRPIVEFGSFLLVNAKKNDDLKKIMHGRPDKYGDDYIIYIDI